MGSRGWMMSLGERSDSLIKCNGNGGVFAIFFRVPLLPARPPTIRLRPQLPLEAIRRNGTHETSEALVAHIVLLLRGVVNHLLLWSFSSVDGHSVWKVFLVTVFTRRQNK